MFKRQLVAIFTSVPSEKSTRQSLLSITKLDVLIPMLALEHLLQPFGLDTAKRIKLVRHQDQRLDISALYRAGQFEVYQSLQGRAVFDKCDMLVSFLGESGTHALFVGAYTVSGVSKRGPQRLPKGFLYPQMDVSNHFNYLLTKDDRFNELQDRLVIEWGSATRSWVQKFKPNSKAVVEVLPKGYVREFPGFLDFVLRFEELATVIANPVANREWHRMLGSVAGIYLILDTATGRQYVGSAYGEKGILGRWASYAKSGHGGNEQLKSLILSRPDAKRDLRFSVLQTLPKTLTAREVIAYEVLHKQKLGTRAHGLNSN